MRHFINLSTLILSTNIFAQWTNPYACDPNKTHECWISCFNKESSLDEPMIRVYISPSINRESKYLIQRENFFSGKMRTHSTGKVVRDDLNPLSIDFDLGKSNLSVSVKPDRISENNTWILSGLSNIAGKRRKMICSYGTKLFLDGYKMYIPGFPSEFYRSIYNQEENSNNG